MNESLEKSELKNSPESTFSPLFSRKFNERLRNQLAKLRVYEQSGRRATLLALSLVLGFSLFLNLQQRPATTFFGLAEKLAADPQNSSLHRQLGQWALTNNELEAARYEANLAWQLSRGTDPSAEKILIAVASQEAAPRLLADQIRRWQQLALVNKNYRDAYLKLALLRWQNYQLAEARRDLEIVRTLDPNNLWLDKLEILLGR